MFQHMYSHLAEHFLPIFKTPFAFEASRPDTWNWPYATNTYQMAERYQNYWQGNQLPNESVFLAVSPEAYGNVGNHKLWSPAPQYGIQQLPYGTMSGQAGLAQGMSQSQTNTLLSKMSSVFATMNGSNYGR